MLTLLASIGKVVAAVVGVVSLAIAAYCYFYKDPWLERLRSDQTNERK